MTNPATETAKVRSFRDLIAWQKSMALAEVIYKTTTKFPSEEKFGLTSQMIRAAVSIASNIAEGQSRQTRGEFLQFIGHARGSLAELETQTLLSARLGLLATADETGLVTQINEVARLLNGLKTSLATK